MQGGGRAFSGGRHPFSYPSGAALYDAGFNRHRLPLGDVIPVDFARQVHDRRQDRKQHHAAHQQRIIFELQAACMFVASILPYVKVGQ